MTLASGLEVKLLRTHPIFGLKKGASTSRLSLRSASMRIDGKVKRQCTRAMFTRVHQLAGKHTLRDWLCYSRTNGTLFCFTCFILSKAPMDQFSTEFSDWKDTEMAFNTLKVPFLGEPIIGNLSVVYCAHF